MIRKFNLIPEVLKPFCEYESSGDLVKMQILNQEGWGGPEILHF